MESRLVNGKAQAAVPKKLPVGGVQVVGDHPHPAFQSRFLHRLTDALLTSMCIAIGVGAAVKAFQRLGGGVLPL